MIKRTHRVDALKTLDHTDIIHATKTDVIHFKGFYGEADEDMGDEYRHLHVTAPQEINPIEEGDWCLFFDSTGALFTDAPQQFNPDKGHVLNDGLRKIVGSTDESLEVMGLSHGFQKAFCMHGGKIQDILVEVYEEHRKKDGYAPNVEGAYETFYIPLKNAEGNLSIHEQPPKMYTQKQLESHIHEAVNDALCSPDGPLSRDSNSAAKFCNEWINNKFK